MPVALAENGCAQLARNSIERHAVCDGHNERVPPSGHVGYFRILVLPMVPRWHQLALRKGEITLFADRDN